MNDAGIIDVRDDERFDEARVAAWLRAHALPGSDAPMTVRQFSGGKANLTYLLQFGDDVRHVLRRPPLGPVARGAHDMAREFRVLSRLHQVYRPAPRAWLFCDQHEILGADFFIMEYRQGVVVRERMPAGFAAIVDAPQRMSFALVDALADLHVIDPAAAGLADLGRPEGFIERQISGWYQRWQVASIEPMAAIDAIHAWLLAHQPPSQRVSLVHNDCKLDNALLSASDPGRIEAIFDWDMCTLGDPLSDLGALLTYWCRPDDPPEFHAMATMPVDSRFPTRRELIERYALRSGLDVGHAHFHHVLGLFRLCVILIQIHVRYQRGQTRDQRFANYGDLARLAADWALRIAG